MELKKEYFKRYNPNFVFKVKTLFAKTIISDWRPNESRSSK